MMELNNRQLADAISEVIEELVLMFVDMPEQPPEDWQPQIRATIEFTGPYDGQLVLLANNELCDTLAANLLGADHHDAEVLANAHDALGELLNVVCGNMVTKLFSTQYAFHLQMPVVEPYNSEQQDTDTDQRDQADQGCTECVLIMDDQPAKFTLQLVRDNSERYKQTEVVR